MRRTTTSRSIAAVTTVLSAAALAMVAASPARALPLADWMACDSYDSRAVDAGYLRVPSRSSGFRVHRCKLQRGDEGDGVRVLQISLAQCYGQSWIEDTGVFDSETERALRSAQDDIGDPGPDGIYTPMTRNAGFQFAIFAAEGPDAWDPTGECQGWGSRGE